MRRLTLVEGAAASQVDLSPAEAAALEEAELAVVSRSPGSDLWSVAPGSKVGVVRIGELQVSVAPKIAVDRLVFLMGYAAEPSYWRDHSVHLDSDRDLPEALAHAFVRLATKSLEQGLLQGYRSVDESLPVLRGRVRVRDQIGRRFGMGLPLEVTFDDFTVDITENQVLLAATSRLLRVPGLGSAVRHRLHKLRLLLAGVRELGRGEPVPRWTPSRLNARYHPALRVAELVLAGDSFDQRMGGVRVSGFVVDMWRVFEDFVCVALSEALADRGSASFQHRMHLDVGRRVRMRPDFYWSGHDGRRIVADAKYKAEKPSGFPQADLYQLLAYCTVLGLPEGHLVYAAGEEEPVAHDVVGSGVVVHCHTLDLGAAPQALLSQVAALANRMIAA